jgi:hypothetical protein
MISSQGIPLHYAYVESTHWLAVKSHQAATRVERLIVQTVKLLVEQDEPEES